MAQYELESLFTSSIDGLKKMVMDTETVVGKPIELSDGTTVIPLSRLSVGYGMGGWNYDTTKDDDNIESKKDSITAGTGGGATVKPVGFLVVSGGNAKLLNVESETPFEKLCDMLPSAIQSFAEIFKKDK